jgi:hypothetical protein
MDWELLIWVGVVVTYTESNGYDAIWLCAGDIAAAGRLAWLMSFML